MDSRATSLSLLDRVRNHDEEAWQRLVDLYGPLVRHWCVRAGLPPDEVHDVTQEVFLAVHRSLDQFVRQPGGSFRGWLRGITRHKLLDHRRRQGGEAAAAGGTEARRIIEDVPDPEADADDAPQVSDLYQRALRLVRAEFEPRTWEAFWQSVVEGQPTALVAEGLGLSPVGVRVARSRVLGRLREELGDLRDFAGPGDAG
jgi:RNA polymerase sigma-70 factor (ECF subfamily)